MGVSPSTQRCRADATKEIETTIDQYGKLKNLLLFFFRRRCALNRMKHVDDFSSSSLAPGTAALPISADSKTETM
ncbi:MAG: hypothetical protein A3I66_19235 [Burkholderiales bacterium RIFCSPLOWO2_02_FULL_57_36]|nr:MAG: hypothetical protein A3I66_19235 [Burkholderiales bacterium RIFCSPLOWO2_02_FULL_57_36]